ncbi:hypothetical protein GCM10018952_69520 [Streptosporangium vulgare]
MLTPQTLYLRTGEAVAPKRTTPCANREPLSRPIHSASTKGRLIMRLFQRSSRSNTESASEPPRLPHRWATILGFSGLVGSIVGVVAGFAVGGIAGVGAGLTTGIGIAVLLATWLQKAID